MTAYENMTREEREQTPLGSFVYEPHLPLPVRDYLSRYLNGTALPYSDNLDETMHSDTEMLVAVLADHLRTNDPLPEAAVDFVREYLYRLEESADVHIWNNPDVLRVAYPLLITFASESEGLIVNGSDAVSTAAVKTALRRLCTRRELMEFYDRHGIEDAYTGRANLAGSAPIDEGNYDHAAAKLSRLLAAPRTDEKTRRDLGAALIELASLTDTHVDHPALAARAMVLMCESETMLANSENPEHHAHRAALHLIAMIDALPEMAKGKGGA